MSKHRRQQRQSGFCAKCHQLPAASNGYCAPCNAVRMAESRGHVPLPEMAEGREVRNTVDKTFELLDSVPGSIVEVKGAKFQSNDDGTVTFYPTNRQQKRLAERLRHIK